MKKVSENLAHLRTINIIELENEIDVSLKFGFSLTNEPIENESWWIIFHAVHRIDISKGKPFVARILPLDSFDQQTLDYLLHDGLRILKYCCHFHHLHLPTLYEIMRFHNKVYIFEEMLIYKSLAQIIIESGPINESTARLWCKQIVTALDFLHDIGIAHNNLSVLSVFFGVDNLVKITGLEHACVYWNSVEKKMQLQRKSKCEIKESAPEVICSYFYDPTKADIWNFAVLLICILLGHYPFINDKNSTFEDEWKNTRDKIFKTVSAECFQLLCECLQLEPNARLTTKQILQHAWFVDFVDVQ
ncbi:kinase domain protein-like protein [Dinothrombium tinctorium]|uniref:Kinase domain protein-like protein n=1 Tax=Dinothrombium tinctorium TaxID=1965070 RepID=A0A3S3P1N2_9ACAR|nr:kinase domain protein-like protein [Dinothrombium tinctorium]RWS06139.1 kinase domain protein-like protein [Dinothrombium tinctorium]